MLKHVARLALVVGGLLLAACSTTPERPTLTACGDLGALCGHLTRPIDPSGKVPGHLEIGFELYPHRDAVPNAGTIVATEGGPGFPTTGSRISYLQLFAPLLGSHDLLLVDNRGTGTSTPIDCHELQTMALPTAEAIGACGRSLGPAANYYGTGLAADDIAAVMDALRIARVDLYGDSYGTNTAQAFAGRHPDRLHSLVLDGAFPVIGGSGFFPDTGADLRRNVDLVCARTPSCAALPGTPLARLRTLIDRLRTAPVKGQAADGDGKLTDAVVDPETIGTVLYDATYDPVVYRELDPAVRAYLDGNDAAPLLRLVAENLARSDSRDPTGNPALYSYGLFAAVSCVDYPQIYSMTSTPAARRTEEKAALAAKQSAEPDLYGPLAIAEWQRLQLDYSTLDLCLDWPVGPSPYPPGQPVAPGSAFTQAPTLVLSGELDTTTTPQEGTRTAALFPHAQQLIFANSFHVDAIGDMDDCAAVIVRRFVATLDPGDVSCAGAVAPLRLVPAFVRHAADAAPIEAAPGNAANRVQLSVAATAVATAGDVLTRWWRTGDGHGVGLRGGSFTVERPADIVHMVLTGVRWADDLAVSGTVDWNQTNQQVVAHLTFVGDSAATGTLTAKWNEHQKQARAAITGTIGGRAVTGSMIAP